MICFVDDVFVSDAKIPLLDLGVLRGLGVFEFARMYDAEFFHLDTHIKRFFSSAHAIGLKVPVSEKDLELLCWETLKKNDLQNGSIKMVLTAGTSSNGFEVEDRPRLALIPGKIKTSDVYLKVATAHYERYLPECKTLSYLPAILERRKAQAKGFDEVLFLDRNGYILEGARENFFAVKNGVLITPKDGVLNGITRQCVIEIAKELMKVQERPIPYAELKMCSEAFFTSTAREIAPIERIDDMQFSISKAPKLLEIFRDRAFPVVRS